MAEKSARRLALEASLAEDPGDGFLRYGLAMQCLREGDVEEGRERLRALVADDPAGQIAAYQQLGQSYLDEGQSEEARRWFVEGIARARARGDLHAAAEMEGFLALIG
jgi:thioredoxin-like negative regulator of GroEL